MENTTKQRATQLSELGLKIDGREKAYLDKKLGIYIPFLDIQTYDDQKWEVMIKEVKDRISNQKQFAEFKTRFLAEMSSSFGLDETNFTEAELREAFEPDVDIDELVTEESIRLENKHGLIRAEEIFKPLAAIEYPETMWGTLQAFKQEMINKFSEMMKDKEISFLPDDVDVEEFEEHAGEDTLYDHYEDLSFIDDLPSIDFDDNGGKTKPFWGRIYKIVGDDVYTVKEGDYSSALFYPKQASSTDDMAYLYDIASKKLKEISNSKNN